MFMLDASDKLLMHVIFGGSYWTTTASLQGDSEIAKFHATDESPAAMHGASCGVCT